jgi:alpha-galactosidase
VTEFFPERFPDGKYRGKTLGVDVFPLEATTARGDERYAAMRAQAVGEQPLDEGVFRRTVGEHEQLLTIIGAIRSDSRQVFAANVPNLGAVDSLPDDAFLEVPCAATARGLTPLQITDLPDTLAAILSRKLAATRLTVEAALTGSRSLFTEALLADGCVSNREAADRLRDDLLEAQRAYLPGFFPAD